VHGDTEGNRGYARYLFTHIQYPITFKVNDDRISRKLNCDAEPKYKKSRHSVLFTVTQATKDKLSIRPMGG